MLLPAGLAREGSMSAIDSKRTSDCSYFYRSFGAASPTLIVATFSPHSPHCYSFTAVIRDGYDEQRVFFGQLGRLIASIGHVGKIDDFTIKLIEQHSFFVTSLSLSYLVSTLV